MTHTDIQLKQTLVKMLPEKIQSTDSGSLFWLKPSVIHVGRMTYDRDAFDTELLHLCWLVEETLTPSKRLDYVSELMDNQGLDLWQRYHATWQQRTIALAKVLGIEIV